MLLMVWTNARVCLHLHLNIYVDVFSNRLYPNNLHLTEIMWVCVISPSFTYLQGQKNLLKSVLCQDITHISSVTHIHMHAHMYICVVYHLNLKAQKHAVFNLISLIHMFCQWNDCCCSSLFIRLWCSFKSNLLVKTLVL